MSWSISPRKVAFAACLLCVGLFLSARNSPAFEWKEIKGKHFVIYYADEISFSWARQVAREAEAHYTDIARKLGYTKYSDYWTWDQRVNIYIYPDQQSFLEQTGLPDWSSGMASRDRHTMAGRIIASYKQEDLFIDGVLPHEITHLILKDYIGVNAPLWFEEGVAQLQEESKLQKALEIMPKLARQGEYFPLKHLLNYDIRIETDRRVVAVFYMQSICLLDFLIKRYGSHKFAQLCATMKDGKGFSEALLDVYYPEFSSLEDLEKKWLSYMQLY